MNLKKLTVFCLSCLLAVSVLVPIPVVVAASDTSTQVPSLDDREWQVIQYTNKERSKSSLNLLAVTAQLQNCADTRVNELLIQFTHERPDGAKYNTVLKENGISFSNSGENISSGYYTAKQVVESWMNSPGHKSNILTSDYNIMGAGYAYTSYDYRQHYWLQFFVTRKVTVKGLTFATTLNESASITGGELVILRVTYSDGTYGFIPVIDEMLSGNIASYGGYRVDLSSPSGSSSNDNESTSTGSKKKQLASPTVTVGTRTKNSIKLTWTKVSGATSYVVYRSTNQKTGFKKVLTTKNRSFTNTKLKVGTKYYYYVKATNGKDTAGDSRIVSATTKKK
jgi:uncharacterized protein YkwD